ncbi:MAG: dephospho-CoA kinase [Hydrogenophaga sp.]
MNRSHRAPPFKLGLTGGIGSGKSTVAAALRDLGAQLIDADAVSRATTQANGTAMPAIVRVFGAHFMTSEGALNRDLMRALVFSKPEARAQLEAIVHPLIHEEIASQVATSTARCLVFDVPLLVESPIWRSRLDRICVVDCAENTQLRRVQQRSGWDIDAVQAVIASQASRRQRLAAADDVIFNDDVSLAELNTLVRKFAATFGL